MAAILAAVEASRIKLAQLVPAMGMLVPPDTATHRMLSMVLTAPHPTADLAPPDDFGGHDRVQGRDAEHATAARVAPPPPVLTADLLAAGIQDVMDTLAGDAFQLNAVLRMILETMLRALRLRRAWCSACATRRPTT